MGPPNSKSSKKTPEMNVSELDLIFAKKNNKKYSKTKKLYFSTKVKKIDFFFDFPYTLGGGPLKLDRPQVMRFSQQINMFGGIF